jgi:hypothetical protein
MDVTLLLVVLTTTFHVTITTNVHLILVAQQKDAYMRKLLVMMEMLAPKILAILLKVVLSLT